MKTILSFLTTVILIVSTLMIYDKSLDVETREKGVDPAAKVE